MRFVFFLTAAFAGEIYTYTDKNGNTVITNEPVPEKYEKKAKKIDSYERSSPEEIRKYEAERKANQQGMEAERRQNQQINSAQQGDQKQSTGKSRIDLEKKRLEEGKNANSPSEKFNDVVRKNTEKREKQLESDPDQYFYDKEQRDKAAAAHPHGIVICPPTGGVCTY